MKHPTLHTSGALVAVWEITETEDELVALLANFDVYEKKIFQLKTRKRKLEFLATRVALNSINTVNVVVDYTPEGKPFCVANNLKISISHSGKWVAVIAHPQYDVGIDIEIPTNRFLKLYKRFLNTKEQNTLFDASDLRKVQLAWGAKEALYKIIGNEAVNFDKQLEIVDFKVHDTGIFTGIHTGSGKKYDMHYSVTNEYNLVYCIDN